MMSSVAAASDSNASLMVTTTTHQLVSALLTYAIAPAKTISKVKIVRRSIVNPYESIDGPSKSMSSPPRRSIHGGALPFDLTSTSSSLPTLRSVDEIDLFVKACLINMRVAAHHY